MAPDPAVSTRTRLRTLAGCRAAIRSTPPGLVIAVLAIAPVVLVAVFLTIDLKGNIAYVLPRRAIKVSAMLLVAVAVGVSTLLFQTVTANRILTPSIMGFDSLYILVQTALAFMAGAATLATAPSTFKFSLEILLMVGFSAFLYRWMFTGATRSLHLLLLVGIVLGTLFRGFSSLLQRLMEPSEFIILQDLFFASFNNVDSGLLGVSAVLIVLVCFGVWRMRHTLDVLALGREVAINVGVDHKRVVMRVLLACSLLVVSLGYQICRGFRHAWLLPIVVLIGAIALVGGQLLLERVFGFATALSVIIEFTGGILFLYLLLKGSLK